LEGGEGVTIIYHDNTGPGDSDIRKIGRKIRMIIEKENDSLRKKPGICSKLFNIEGSVNFKKYLTDGHLDDDASDNNNKFFEHIPYMKEFCIPKDIQEISDYSVCFDARRRAENFARSYYKTVNNLLEYALSHGTEELGRFNGATLDLTAPDGLPLFSELHKYGTDGETQSNLFYVPITETLSCETFSETLSNLAKKLSDMKDEKGERLGYRADTIILPGNRIEIEKVVKQVVKEEKERGEFWDVVVLQNWQSQDDRVIIMSSEANAELSGNMFFNRVPLIVSHWEDKHTGNYIWNGRCRFGVGFGSYKHVLMAVDSSAMEDKK
jgi:hypothetical protein